jgi:16S rRNA (cytosine967-C5)-methyltransferase
VLLKVVSGQNPREIAVEILGKAAVGRWEQRKTPDLQGAINPLEGPAGQAFVEDLLERALAKGRLPPADRGLCQELVYGVVRWQAALDWLISQKTRGPSPKPSLQNILRLGLYQIFWLNRIPNHAAVNETVEIAKRKGFKSQAGFINAVLRGYLREYEITQVKLRELDQVDPALRHSHPQWLFERWRRTWGEENARRLMEWNNQPPKTFARINSLKADPGKVLATWRDENVDYDFVRQDWLEENIVFVLKSHPPFSALASFRQGLFYLQDPSTLLAVRELDPHPGEAILDLCAAPGGKLTFIAQLLKNEGKLVAYDTNPSRLKLIEENCARLGVTCVKTISAEGLSNRQDWMFDRILVDAPCSNTGVMRRRVDLRWRIREEEIIRLQTMQIELLRQAALLLRPGGNLIYSTCSLEPEENDQVIERFVAEQPAFQIVKRRQLLPWVERVDGAYVANLRRK